MTTNARKSGGKLPSGSAKLLFDKESLVSEYGRHGEEELDLEKVGLEEKEERGRGWRRRRRRRRGGIGTKGGRERESGGAGFTCEPSRPAAAPFTKLLLQTFPASTTAAAAAASFHTAPGLLAPDLHQGGLAPATDLHRSNNFDGNRSKLSLLLPPGTKFQF